MQDSIKNVIVEIGKLILVKMPVEPFFHCILWLQNNPYLSS